LDEQVVVVGFGPPQPAIWSYHAADCQPTAAVLSVSLCGPVCWNALPDYLKSPGISFYCFRQQLKHFYFADIDNISSTLAH